MKGEREKAQEREEEQKWERERERERERVFRVPGTREEEEEEELDELPAAAFNSFFYAAKCRGEPTTARHSILDLVRQLFHYST